jgi:hypothetical protein
MAYTQSESSERHANTTMQRCDPRSHMYVMSHPDSTTNLTFNSASTFFTVCLFLRSPSSTTSGKFVVAPLRFLHGFTRRLRIYQAPTWLLASIDKFINQEDSSSLSILLPLHPSSSNHIVSPTRRCLIGRHSYTHSLANALLFLFTADLLLRKHYRYNHEFLQRRLR